MNVVLDTNILLVSLPSHSPFHPIYQALRQHRYTAFVTNEILTEYEEQIGFRLGIVRTDVQIRELLNLPGMHLIDAYYRWQLITADIDDNKFADCAIACGADYLVTNDRHFDVLKTVTFPVVQVIRAEEFLNVLATLT
ncbi:putative toxin-antitoxin system toxin component, PIN family [Spirosoma soli]|uniref:Toxin-antitoxin system toxin component, PIN family n=1 Tax=Spirosoma soli TaxID=1770529 RepID=A0ABW5M1D5_9BACT